MKETNSRGRKRDNNRTEAILKAASELLIEVGFDRFKVQDVATKAGAGTGAIYRRWSTKEALIIDAIKMMPTPVAPVTDNPLKDLRALVAPRCKSAEERPDLLPGLISAMRSDPEIKEAVKSGYTMDNFRSVISRIVGEDYPHIQLLCELTSALALLRSSFTPEEIDGEKMTDEIVSFIESLKKLK
ncbi:MAG: TetR/AcrR family transcriptional regulator [Chitinophagales bacterium]|nr:TetR/AcrR family transcriptional regulator [Chitinophagales bacterium]